MLGLLTSYKMLDQQLAILARDPFSFRVRAGVLTSAVQSEEEEEEFVNAATSVDYDLVSSNAIEEILETLPIPWTKRR